MEGRDIVVIICGVSTRDTFIHRPDTFIHRPDTFIQEVEPGKVAGIWGSWGGIAIVNGVPDIIFLVVHHDDDGMNSAGITTESLLGERNASSVKG